MPFDDSAKRVVISGGAVDFYENYTTTNLYVERVFGARCSTLTISNDSSTDTVQISHDGATLEAELNPGESLTLQTKGYNSLYVKATAGGGKVRIWGW